MHTESIHSDSHEPDSTGMWTAQQNTTNNNTYPQIKTQAYQITGGCNMFTADFDTGSWHDGVVEPGDYQILRMTHYKKDSANLLKL